MVNIFDRALGRVVGKRIAILGESGTGKTHMQTFLRERTIPPHYEQTVEQVRMRASVARLLTVGSDGNQEKVVVRLRRSYDVPGSAEHLGSWKEVLQSAEIMLYLFRADWVFYQDEGHLKRVREDADALAGILRGMRPHRLTGAALVGTHYDYVRGFQGPETGSEFVKWHRLIAEERPAIKQVRQVLSAQLPRPPALVIGSMQTIPQTQELLFRVFSQEL